jgi:hypothetical protein
MRAVYHREEGGIQERKEWSLRSEGEVGHKTPKNRSKCLSVKRDRD